MVFLSSLSQIILLRSVEPRDCIERVLWVLVQTNDVMKQQLGLTWLRAFGGGFPFWRSKHKAYFVFSPGTGGKLFFFFSLLLHFETWDVVLALILVTQSCSFAFKKPVDKMRKINFKPHFLLPWKSLWKNKVAKHRRHWNSTSCSLKLLVTTFTRAEKKGFANNLSTFSRNEPPTEEPSS